jgi:dethiobiotin synthetase
MPEKRLNDQSGLFITATDTGIGKTFISRLFVETFMKMLPVTYFKPVQTGSFSNSGGELVSPDFNDILQGGFQADADYEIHVPYRFKPACSPHLACRIENRSISLARIDDCYRILKGEGDHTRLVIVEGAGGIYTPLGSGLFMIDIMVALGLPVVLVVSPRLGTLNHTILSLNALRSRNLRVAGVVMNHAGNDSPDFISIENSEFIRDYVRPTPFTEIGFKAHSSSIEAFCRELIR